MFKFKKITLLLFILTIAGCQEYPPQGYTCSPDSRMCYTGEYPYKLACNREKQAKFIIDCARAANPMSDEEGEDLVYQCQKTSTALFCEKEFYKSN